MRLETRFDFMAFVRKKDYEVEACELLRGIKKEKGESSFMGYFEMLFSDVFACFHFNEILINTENVRKTLPGDHPLNFSTLRSGRCRGNVTSDDNGNVFIARR